MAENDFTPVTLVSPVDGREQFVDTAAQHTKLSFDGWTEKAEGDSAKKTAKAADRPPSKRASSRAKTGTGRPRGRSGASATKQQNEAEQANQSESGVSSVQEQGAVAQS